MSVITDLIDENSSCHARIAELEARIVELESQYQRDVFGLNNEGDPIGGDPAGGYANDNARLRSELAAIKAQEPTGWYTEDHLDDKSATTYSWAVAERWVEKGWPVSPLYAAPVSEAKAQCVVMPERWNVPRPMWKDARQPYGNPLNHADIEAAEKFNLALDEVARLNAIEYAAPVSEAKAQGVVMPPSPYMPGSQPTDFTDYELGEIHGRIAMWEEVKRLNAAPVQQVSVPDGKVCVPVEVLRLYEFMAASFTPFTSQHEQIAISLRKAKAAMLAAAPAAPAADAGLVEALKQAFPLFDEDGLNELYHHCEIAVLGDRKRLHKLLATHSAKGVV